MNASRYLKHCLRSVLLRSLLSLKERDTGIVMCAIADDHIGVEIFANELYEKEVLLALKSFLVENASSSLTDVALDIGANIGNHSLFFSQFFQDVICFEPNPHIADMIEVNKTLNHRKNVKVIRAAVVEFPGKYKLSQIDGNVGAASLQPASGNDPTDQIVSTIAGTEVKTLLNGKRVGFIKVDTEGFESEVFSSLKELILTCQPVVAFEQQPTEIQGGTSKCIELLKTMGYEKIYVPVVSPNSRNPLLRTFKRIFLGRVTRYAERKRLDPDFYPLIIMMPKNA